MVRYSGERTWIESRFFEDGFIQSYLYYNSTCITNLKERSVISSKKRSLRVKGWTEHDVDISWWRLIGEKLPDYISGVSAVSIVALSDSKGWGQVVVNFLMELYYKAIMTKSCRNRYNNISMTMSAWLGSWKRNLEMRSKKDVFSPLIGSLTCYY